eukprot:scaffold322178_cov15-Tisochrysis_lutea.AAC.1
MALRRGMRSKKRALGFAVLTSSRRCQCSAAEGVSLMKLPQALPSFLRSSGSNAHAAKLGASSQTSFGLTWMPLETRTGTAM